MTKKPRACPICGGTDVAAVKYNERTQNLLVMHTDRTQCSRAPVDERGNYVN